jgi:rhodanese-related sulfurtransferase
MTSFRSSLLAGATCWALISCARHPVAPTPSPAPPEKPALPAEGKKKPRMNGRGKLSSISLTDAFELQQTDRAFILDARPAFFYRLGRIPGAVHLPKTDALAQITAKEPEIKAALASGKTLIVYCTNFACPDARAVAMHLASFGYSSSTLTGGWDAWKESGLPTE